MRRLVAEPRNRRTPWFSPTSRQSLLTYGPYSWVHSANDYDIEPLNTFFKRHEFRLGLCLASDIHGSATFRTETLLESMQSLFWAEEPFRKSNQGENHNADKMVHVCAFTVSMCVCLRF
jgi:hypothetical protein